MNIEKITLNEARHVTLTAYLQAVGGEFRNIVKRPAVLVLPGGGYAMCSDREADPVALAYAAVGFQAFILRYSVGKDAVWPTPLQDYEEAMALIRSKADEWKLYTDKIAVVGFSAGGHLAAAAATMADNRPDAAILGYSVLEGETAKEWLPSAPDLVSKVTHKTCPCFLFATRTDNIVPVTNTLQFMTALEKAGVGFESHIYAYGPHGFSTADDSVHAPGICPRAASWVADSIGWLHDVFGDFGDQTMTAPRVTAHVNEDAADYLSVDCTMAHLMANASARAILVPLLEEGRKRMAEKYGDQMSSAENSGVPSGLGQKMTLRAALSYGNVPAEIVEKLNNALKQIPNSQK